MSKKGFIALSVGAIAFGIAGVVYAATATKYFQKIKQNTKTGAMTISVTTAKSGSITTSRTGHDATLFANWNEGDTLPSSGTPCYSILTAAEKAIATAGRFSDEQKQAYSTTVSGKEPVIAETDPPTFYAKIQYYKNGKAVARPTIESSGTQTYTTTSTDYIVHCDGRVEKTSSSNTSLPKVGVSATSYTYKIVTLQPSN